MIFVYQSNRNGNKSHANAQIRIAHMAVPDPIVAAIRVSRFTDSPANIRKGSRIVSFDPVRRCSARVTTQPPRSHWDATVMTANTTIINRIGLWGFTTKKRGWGLGLSLTKRIVEEYHKGKIKVLNSEIGKGTTMQVSFKRT